MHHTTEKGTKVNRTERSTKILIALMAVLGVVGFAPGVASAAFTRPFLRQLTGTTSGPFSCPSGFKCPAGLAVDGEDHLWVSEINGPPYPLNKFNSAEHENAFLETLDIEGKNPPVFEGREVLTLPEGLAIDRSTGSFYVSGGNTVSLGDSYIEVFDKTGAFVKRFGPFQDPHVAVDNSTNLLEDPSACSPGCTVYVAHSSADDAPPNGDGLPQGIEKLDSSGVPVNFKGCPECSSYVSGNQITGTPSKTFEGSNHPTPTSVAVDSLGNIYVVNNGEGSQNAIDEYEPSGKFLREFTGAETPGLGESHDRGGFGGTPEGIAVDSLSNHLLVSIDGNSREGKGVVDEFDIATGKFLHQITETSEGAKLSELGEITVDSHGDLYVVDLQRHAVEVYGPGLFDPTVRLGEATQRTPSTAILSGAVNPEAGVNPEHSGLSECKFEYVPQAQLEANGFESVTPPEEAPCVPAAASIPANEAFDPVHAQIAGLASGTTYRYRLLAKTSGVIGGTSASEPLAFTAPHAPRVDSTSVANISSTFADLHAQINPLGAATTYHFEYSSDGVTWVKAPVPDAGIGSGGASGSADASVVQQIGPLLPGTTYAFRVVATSEIEGRTETTVGVEAAFTTLAPTAPGLPDGRSYELLTPPNKGSEEDLFTKPETVPHTFDNGNVGYPSDSGEEFLLGKYVFKREINGWQTSSLASPSPGVQAIKVQVFDPSGFSQVGIADYVGSKASVGGANLLSLLGPPGGPYTTIYSETATSEHTATTQIAGASRGLSHVVLESSDHTVVTGDETQDPGSKALYEYAGGTFTLVSVNGKGAPFRCGALLGQSAIAGSRRNAVSADGSRIFFTAPDPYVVADGTPSTKECWNGATSNVPQLYLRLEGTTVRVSSPEAGWSPQGQVAPSIYAGASEDGSKVFFVSETELTKDDAGHNVNNMHDPELYEYDTETGMLTRISAGESGKAAGGVYTVPAINADGSVVYFTAFGRLAYGAPSVGEHEVNLYRHDTRTNTTVYVATVDRRDYPSSAGSDTWWGRGAAKNIPLEVALAPDASWYTTPDGRYLLFASTSDLASYSTAEPSHAPGNGDCPVTDVETEAAEFGHCNEVYRYDSLSGDIVCVSCDRSGAPPVSDAYFAHGAGGGAPAEGPVRAMSDDGSYVFFDSADPLVSQANNHTQDVFEWEARGKGGCELAAGCVHLLSSGHEPSPSFFLGASADGSNVFFGTHARLVPQDTDESGDLYDARIGAGFPVQGGKGPCEGNACENPATTPIDATPGSLTFSGAGNLTTEVASPPTKKVTPKKTAKCKEGFIKKHNKCVKAKAKKAAKKAKKASNNRRVK